ncbi:MAG: hypothetical protein U1E26_06285 [Coriobacteriia bacterium]|nr:hypothetical protein [Coriobacteriia bacterium]
MSSPRRRFATITLALALVLVAPSVALAEEAPSGSPLAPVLERTLDKGVPSMTGQVKKVAIGSTGATITLAAGDEILVDLSELAGARGGTNYLGLGMLLFGLSVLTRLLATLGRLTRPFTRMRPRGWDQ